jgi:hypothetical protein
MIKWLGENGGELVGTKKYLCVLPVCGAHHGGALCGMTLHSHRVLEPGVLLLLLSLCAKERIFVYKLDSFVGFIGDVQLHALECYVGPGLNGCDLNFVELVNA